MATSAMPKTEPYRKILYKFKAMKQMDFFGVGKA